MDAGNDGVITQGSHPPPSVPNIQMEASIDPPHPRCSVSGLVSIRDVKSDSLVGSTVGGGSPLTMQQSGTPATSEEGMEGRKARLTRPRHAEKMRQSSISASRPSIERVGAKTELVATIETHRRNLEKEIKKRGIKIDSGKLTYLGALKKWWNDFFKSKGYWLIIAFVAITLYFFVGAVGYVYLNDWSYSASLYYAAQAGWSVGFGVLIEQNDGSLWFTSFYAILGASMIGGAVAFMMSFVIEREKTWGKEIRINEIRRTSSIRMIDEADVKGAPEMITSRISQFNNDAARLTIPRRTISMANANKPENMRCGCGCLQSFRLVCGSRFSSCMDKSEVFYEDYITEIRVSILFILWILAGIVYGLVREEWNLARSVYFAITSLSTGGLQGPSVDGDNETFNNWFVALWVMTGVPLFGIFMGLFAGVLVEAYVKQQLSDKIHKQVKNEDMQLTAQLNSFNDDDEITRAEYLVFSLIRSGLVTEEIIAETKKRFAMLDIDKGGTISREEMMAALEFDRYDINGDGNISIAEFIAISHKLKVGKSIEERIKIFDKIDKSGDGSISREEFFLWWTTERTGADDSRSRRKSTRIQKPSYKLDLPSRPWDEKSHRYHISDILSPSRFRPSRDRPARQSQAARPQEGMPSSPYRPGSSSNSPASGHVTTV
ncbi:hypothetical protein AAMO2058_000046800 [Amorphochlora amoebiformis]